MCENVLNITITILMYLFVEYAIAGIVYGQNIVEIEVHEERFQGIIYGRVITPRHRGLEHDPVHGGRSRQVYLDHWVGVARVRTPPDV